MKKDKLNILVVDDSKTTRDMLAGELNTIGYVAHAAASTEEADKIVNKSHIDILFLDLKLPGMDGLKYLGKLQKEEKDVIVIVMTAYQSPESAVDAIEKGAYDYVIKPIEPGHLELIIKRALKRYQLEQERKNLIAGRDRALKDFMENAKETDLLIMDFKKEINSLLAELGRQPKYKIL